MSATTLSLAAARRRSGAGLACLVASGILLGTGGLTGTLLSRAAGLSPVAVAAYRLAVGGGLIILFLTLTGRPAPRGKPAWVRVAVVGGLTAAYQASFFAALSLTSVSLATLITIGAFPVLVLAGERLTGRRRVDRRVAGAIALALAGLALLVGMPSGGFGAGAVLGSAGLAVLAAGGFAAVTLVGVRPVPGLDPLRTTGYGFAVGGLCLLPVAAAASGVGMRLSATGLALLVALGTGPTAVAYTLYFRGLRDVGAGTAAVLVLLEPLTSALLGAYVLGDRLGAAGIAGAVLLAAAVVLAARARLSPARLSPAPRRSPAGSAPASPI